MDIQKLVERIKIILLEPKKFFTGLKKEKGVTDAFRFLAITAGFGMICGLIISLVMQPFAALGIGLPMTTTMMGVIVSAILGYGIMLGLSFVWAAILHLWIKLFGGKARYERTYQLSVYSGTPSNLFSWVPAIGPFLWIYNVVLLIVGTPKTHNVSQTRSIVMYIVLFAVLGLILILLAVTMIGTLMYAMGGNGILENINFK